MTQEKSTQEIFSSKTLNVLRYTSTTRINISVDKILETLTCIYAKSQCNLRERCYIKTSLNGIKILF
jgi:hypothetical protein